MEKLLGMLNLNGPVPSERPIGLSTGDHGDGCKCHGHCENY